MLELLIKLTMLKILLTNASLIVYSKSANFIDLNFF